MDDSPATKADLERFAAKEDLAAAIANLATKDELAAAIANLATKDELAAAIANLATKDELAAAVANLATKDELQDLRKDLMMNLDAWGTRLEHELGRHVKSFEEHTQSMIAVLDDKRTGALAEHAADTTLHRPPRKRTVRSPSAR